MSWATGIFAALAAMLVAGLAYAQTIGGGGGGGDRDLLSHANLYGNGLVVVSKLGDNPDVGAGAYEDIWNGGGSYPFPTTALPVRVKAGGNAADTAAGAGARTLTVVGLDQNWAAVTESLTLAGASASAPTTATFIRIDRSYVATSGTYGGSNTGVITIETTGGTTLGVIAAGVGTMRLGIYSVPAGKTAYLINVDVIVSSTSGKSATVRLWRRENADAVAAPFGPSSVFMELNDMKEQLSIHRDAWPSFPAKSDMWASAIAISGSTGVNVYFDIVLKDAP